MLSLRGKHDYEQEIERLKDDARKLRRQLMTEDLRFQAKCKTLRLCQDKLKAQKLKNVSLVSIIKAIRSMAYGIK